MKVVLHIELNDLKEDVTIKDINKVMQSLLKEGKQESQGQQKIDSEQQNNCAKCGKDVDQAVINFCTHPAQKDRFKGKVYCRECQEGY